MNNWNYDISLAPKDRPILAKINSDHELCAGGTCDTNRLCIFHSWSDCLGCVKSDYAVLVFGGEFDDNTYFEPNMGSMPSWWFLEDENLETVANPIAWKYIEDEE